MSTGEQVYLRESLQIKCTSVQLAYSYIGGRIEEQEFFLIGEKKLTFAEVAVCDPVVRHIVGDNISFAKPKKFSNFSSKYKLFKKIVLRGDDALAPLLTKLENAKAEIANLESNYSEQKKQLLLCQKANQTLSALCVKSNAAIGELIAIVKAELNCVPNSVQNSVLISIYSELANLLAQFSSAFSHNIQQIMATPLLLEEKIRDVTLIDQYRQDAANDISTRYNEIELAEKCSADKIRADKESATQQISQKENQLTQEIATRKQQLENERKKCEEKIIKLKKNAQSEIFNALSQLVSEMSKAGGFESQIRETAKNAFVSFSSEDRFFFEKRIPEKKLYNAIKACHGDCSPKNVLALFDDSISKDGSTGILISSRKRVKD